MNGNSCKINWAVWLRRIQWLALVVFSLACTHSVRAQTEDGIKAAFIYNFAKFTEWPANAFSDASTPITVGFVGAGSLADTFEKNVVGKNANGRDFAVKRLTGAAGTENCQIVFVDDASQVGPVLGAAKGRPILTTGDTDHFTTAGGMVGFIKDGAKITFDLDLNSVGAAQLKLDPKICKIARTVTGN